MVRGVDMNKLSVLRETAMLAGAYAPDLVRDELLPEIFSATASRLPNKVALRFAGEAWTFAELDALSDRMAAELGAAGVAPGTFVGLFVERSPFLLAAVLGILKAGGAFLPFDPKAPVDRIETSLSDCAAGALVVDHARMEATDGLSVRRVSLESLVAAPMPRMVVSPRDRGLDRDHPAYVIYTSGSTGRPKGIAVAHRNICHFARSENVVLGVTETDVVWNGFSPAFDMSLEEVWTAWLVGATVVVASPEEHAALDRLPEILTEKGITVLHAVPSLVATFEHDVPSIRVLNVGGEACPPSVVERWWRPNRRILNTYGPTETTVTATAAELRPYLPITIGVPLPNYTAYVLDDFLNPVAPGEVGELCIGGPGVSLGYVGRPELTAEKFVSNPFGGTATGDPMIYRTGDHASVDETGAIVFHGRIDDQVKLRGYRIELGEIEAELSRCEEIAGTAVALKKDAAGTDQLVAYVLPRAGAAIDPAALRARLAAKLPAYMVPNLYKTLDALPRLPNGKMNRKALPEIGDLSAVGDDREIVAPRTATERALVEAIARLIPGRPASVTDDFFTDLGGHSLLAARLVSDLRREAAFRAVALQDLYAGRTLEGIAARIDAAARPIEAAAAPVRAFAPVPRLRFLACGAMQFVGLLVIYGLFAAQILVPFLTYSFVSEEIDGIAIPALAALAVFTVVPPLTILLSIAAKWIIIGRYKPGEYPVWGAYYMRWWFVSRLLEIVPTNYLSGTPIYNIYHRLLGARIGRDCYLGTLDIGAADLVSIGDHSSFGNGVVLQNAVVEDGLLKIGRCDVGAHAYVGSNAVVGRDARVGDWCELGDLGALADGGAIPDGEAWIGSPAHFKAKVDRAAVGEPDPVSRPAAIGYGFAFALLVLLFPLVALIPALPIIVTLDTLDAAVPNGDFSYLVLTPILSLLYIVLVALEIVVLRWVILPRVKEGVYRTASVFYLRKWFVDQMMDLSLGVLHTLYASLYLAPWYRALGVKLGKRAEVSTASSVTHDLLEIGDESFVADAVTLGDAQIRHGRLTLKRTRIGTRTFIGNGALVPDGTDVPDGVLIGCLSVPPEDASRMREGTTWFGIPSEELPTRQTFAGYKADLTFRPTPWRIAGRLAVEFVRIVLPGAVTLACTMLLISATYEMYDDYGVAVSALSFAPLYLAIFGIPVFAVTVLVKWLFVGRYRPGEHPMWTPFVWRSEAVTSIYESLAVPYFLGALCGTPFLSPCMRLLGVRVGKQVFWDTTDVTEFDVVSIGDNAALNEDCGPQTHLFEDRVMKIGPVEIGAHAVVGARSIVLYGARIEEGARLGASSLAMKGETLPAGTAWAGSPAQAA